MKKTSIIAIPVLAVILLLAGVFVWKMVSPTTSPVVTSPGTLPNSVTSETSSKPANPFSFLFAPQVTPIPTPTPASAAAMNADLQKVGDDGGVVDFTSLKSDVSGL